MPELTSTLPLPRVAGHIYSDTRRDEEVKLMLHRRGATQKMNIETATRRDIARVGLSQRRSSSEYIHTPSSSLLALNRSGKYRERRVILK